MFVKTIFILLFLWFTISAFTKYRDRKINFLQFIVWLFLWVGGGVLVSIPKLSQWIAGALGVGRGVDAIAYFAIVFIYFALFQLFVTQESIKRDITKIVRTLALQQGASNQSQNEKGEKG